MSARPTLQTAERGSRCKDQLWSISHYTVAIRGRPPLRKQDYDSLIALITFISAYMCNSLDFLFGLLAYTRKLVVSVGPCLNLKMQYSFLQNQMNGKVPEMHSCDQFSCKIIKHIFPAHMIFRERNN